MCAWGGGTYTHKENLYQLGQKELSLPGLGIYTREEEGLSPPEVRGRVSIQVSTTVCMKCNIASSRPSGSKFSDASRADLKAAKEQHLTVLCQVSTEQPGNASNGARGRALPGLSFPTCEIKRNPNG